MFSIGDTLRRGSGAPDSRGSHSVCPLADLLGRMKSSMAGTRVPLAPCTFLRLVGARVCFSPWASLSLGSRSDAVGCDDLSVACFDCWDLNFDCICIRACCCCCSFCWLFCSSCCCCDEGWAPGWDSGGGELASRLTRFLLLITALFIVTGRWTLWSLK